jgi:hypothetical protein
LQSTNCWVYCLAIKKKGSVLSEIDGFQHLSATAVNWIN